MKIKITLTLIAALVIAAALVVGFQAQKAPRVVHAQTGCGLASLSGTYGFNFAGVYFDSSGNTVYDSSAGLWTLDGQGNVTGKETDSFDGQIFRADTYTGTYTVNSDCTGSLTTNSQAVGPANYDFTLTNGHNQILLVENDSGTNITGQATKQ